eukprot:m.395021 g.395021  ORF g.395021 m.395021 type:complete len:152 (+) comp56382_c1_seq4:182-637(+)
MAAHFADEEEIGDIEYDAPVFDLCFHPTHSLVAAALISGQVLVYLLLWLVFRIYLFFSWRLHATHVHLNWFVYSLWRCACLQSAGTSTLRPATRCTSSPSITKSLVDASNFLKMGPTYLQRRQIAVFSAWTSKLGSLCLLYSVHIPLESMR